VKTNFIKRNREVLSDAGKEVVLERLGVLLCLVVSGGRKFYNVIVQRLSQCWQKCVENGGGFVNSLIIAKDA
jgi:hypothetical protein